MLKASVIIQNNDTIAAHEMRRNQEQRANRSSRWSGIEKKLIALMCFSYWSLIGIGMYCYIKFYAPEKVETNGFGINKLDSYLLRPSENVEESWKSALYDYVNRHANKTAALVDRNEIKCPKMYSLSKNNKLCYFLAKYRERFDYLALLVNKSEAVTFCNAFSNGTVPYGKFMFNLCLYGRVQILLRKVKRKRIYSWPMRLMEFTMQKTQTLLHIRSRNFRSKFVEISDHVSKLKFYQTFSDQSLAMTHNVVKFEFRHVITNFNEFGPKIP